MKLVVVSGTHRAGSRTRRVAELVRRRYAAQEGVEVTLLDLADLPSELLDPTSLDARPEAFAPFQEPVLAADGLVVVTPEYNGGFPGVLKLWIDHLPFPESFELRPVCFVGLSAGRWGALRPVEQLTALWGYREGFVFPRRVFLFDVASHLPDGADDLVPGLARDLLDRQVEEYVDFCRRLRGFREAARSLP